VRSIRDAEASPRTATRRIAQLLWKESSVQDEKLARQGEFVPSSLAGLVASRTFLDRIDSFQQRGWIRLLGALAASKNR
jgi:hypothetical protein